jgi:hypothetical protein
MIMIMIMIIMLLGYTPPNSIILPSANANKNDTVIGANPVVATVNPDSQCA